MDAGAKYWHLYVSVLRLLEIGGSEVATKMKSRPELTNLSA